MDSANKQTLKYCKRKKKHLSRNLTDKLKALMTSCSPGVTRTDPASVKVEDYLYGCFLCIISPSASESGKVRGKKH